ncbi:MAG: hypothetical protein R6V06_10080 [Kiritimatiellia bacterium]
MLDFTDKEKQVLVAAQKGIPVSKKPFDALGKSFNIAEDEVIALFNRLLQGGEARRFGAVFDARRLGFRSALCCMDVPPEKMDDIASVIVVPKGVTHAYHRGWPDELPRNSPGGPGDSKWPNLWFTLATPADIFESELNVLRKKTAPCKIHELPALRRFKIDVVFDMRTRDRDEKTEPRTPYENNAAQVLELSPEERGIVKYFGGDLPVVPDFYEAAADHLGIDPEDLMQTLSSWQDMGVIRRIGLLLRHRRVGFNANGMCCWNVPSEMVVDTGRMVASRPEVTHCYERPVSDVFPFNLFAMIHTGCWQDTQNLFQRISDDGGLNNGRLLLSLKEYKKTSMQFF